MEYISRLEIQYQHLLTLWRSKHMKLKQTVTRNQIVLNINKVKHMSLQQFEDMDPTQREAIIHQLNEDTQRLMTESREVGHVSTDPELEELEKEVDNCNQLIEEMSRGAETVMNPQEAQNVMTDMDNFMSDLDVKVSTLKIKLKSPIPRDAAAVDQLLEAQQTFHRELSNQQPQYHSLKINCESIVRQSEPSQQPRLQSHLSMFIKKWEYVWNISLVHTQTLTISSLILKSLQTANDIVSRYEKELVSHDNLPSDLAQLQSHQEVLQDMQTSLPPCQPIFNQLTEEVTKLKNIQEPTANERDIERFEKEVENINTRWLNVCNQTNERAKRADSGFDILREFKDALLDERNWLAQAQATMMLLDTTVTDRKGLENQIEQVKAFLEEIIEHRPTVEEFNTKGNQYIQFAQTYDCLLENYKDSLQDVLDTGDSKKPKIQSGVDNAIQEIEAVNDDYSKLGAEVSVMLRAVAERLNIPEGDLLERYTLFQPVSSHVPRIRTEVTLQGVKADIDATVQTKKVTTTKHTYVTKRTIMHPVTGEPMTIEEPSSEIPEDEASSNNIYINSVQSSST
uniref:Plectin-like n=1 Tax=Saccoglossus kowalevskii TaxID=10224 RepID=A0ABM0MRF9_SACKO|nr:PREDICTED: plectin-like [Saccoglossus kowalevskii]